MTTSQKRKAKLLAIVTAIASAAAPGVYSALETAKNSWKQRVEQRTRDQQEGDLQANVKANAVAVDTLTKSCVTHKELLTIALRLRQQPVRRVRATRRVRHTPPVQLTRERELDTQLAKLQTEARKEAKLIRVATKITRSKPVMKQAAAVRKLIKQKEE